MLINIDAMEMMLIKYNYIPHIYIHIYYIHIYDVHKCQYINIQ